MSTFSLPERLLVPGKEPRESPNLTRYANLKLINKVRDALGEQFMTIKNSFLGQYSSLVEDAALNFSRNMVTYAFHRRIIAKDENLWFAFAEQPMRFGIVEFKLMTGLKCFEDSAESFKRTRRMRDIPDDHWMLEPKTLAQLLTILKDTAQQDEKLRLGALMLCEIILVSNPTTDTISVENLQRGKDFRELCQLPWGKISYEDLKKSITCLESFDKFYSLSGLSIAFHLWMMCSVKELANKFGSRDLSQNKPLCFQWKSSKSPYYSHVAEVAKIR